MAEGVRDSVVVHADPATILAVIADFEAYPRWQSDVREVEIVDAGTDGRADRVRFVFDAKGFRSTVVLQYRYTATSMRWSLVDSDTLRRDDGVYKLADQGDGTTTVTYELTLETRLPVPGMVRREAARRIAEGALRGLKRHVETDRPD